MNDLQPPKFCGLRTCERFRSSADLQAKNPSTTDVSDELWNPVDSPECLKKGRDQRVEIVILFSQIFDLLDRMDDRRVMLASEASTDLRKGGGCQRLTEIHGYLSRHRHRF